jgi:hypothetical protein
MIINSLVHLTAEAKVLGSIHDVGMVFTCTFLPLLHIDIPFSPVRIRVRIDPPHPQVCRKRRRIGAVLRMRPEKPRSRVTAGVAR